MCIFLKVCKKDIKRHAPFKEKNFNGESISFWKNMLYVICVVMEI